ncbi:ENTH/VHS/GAT family protein [Arabidopsis thaliana]|uniref:TOM1-like protein 7 n=1 Tax=Arabidopsis thaliana TaxID=3702 RepID=TOL7_ARATH|nr:ENTH/VHS/GAT family protein [Arabidopsis thaliana]F4KAU9.1 RecName: Full=TOM1-like protein 7 [Arabidopsis thaliana]AED90388.1 ENTH/VHS/GAT family protein [Arabidopsis thaliana]|eukprot:NP_195796.2 ENTH/VHS/GAT family protein [Arabidopsis thaliana]
MRPSCASSSSSSASPSLRLSSVTVAVDKATSELLRTPDWTIIIAICDSLNSNRWQCKDAIKAVKRRLQHKSSRVQLLTLTLLEAMLKNCGDFVHSHIAEKHLLEDMVKLVRKKGDFEVRNKLLILLDTWNEAFSGVACKHPHYNWAYQELKRCGVKFPQRSKEAPLMLEPPPPVTQSSSSSSMNLMSIGSFRRLDETMATEIESLSLSSLESMRNVMDLVNDMVQAVNPSDKSALKDELIVDLVEQCRSNQKKLIQMLTTTADEDVLARGLELNDSLQVVLARHDAIASGVSLPLLLQAPEPRETSSSLKTCGAAALESADSESSSSSSSSESETDEVEDVKDDFIQLAKRHALLNALHSDEEEETLLLGNDNEKTAEAEAKTQCKDLALFDTTTTTTTKSEQDIIELLSLTLSTTALPSPQTQPQTQHPSFFADDNILMNSYVVPWAQSQEEPQVPKMTQFAPSGPQFQPWPLQQQQPYSYGYPQPQWSGGQVNSNDTTFWSQGGNENMVFERNLQVSNSFPARATGTSGAATAATVDRQP